eukprot:3743408-Amphidinium_carterae.1
MSTSSTAASTSTSTTTMQDCTSNAFSVELVVAGVATSSPSSQIELISLLAASLATSTSCISIEAVEGRRLHAHPCRELTSTMTFAFYAGVENGVTASDVEASMRSIAFQGSLCTLFSVSDEECSVVSVTAIRETTSSTASSASFHASSGATSTTWATASGMSSSSMMRETDRSISSSSTTPTTTST